MVKSATNLTLGEQRTFTDDRKRVQDKTSQDHIEYGTIYKVDLDSSRVAVKKLDGTLFKVITNTREGVTEQKMFPLLTPISDIHLLYGSLREGLKVKIHWIGHERPDAKVYIEVISNNETILAQKYAMPEIERGFSMPV